ncbi:hypothetical protein [Methylosinus sp. RM1]|uniref:hypothetical protein n=1 Tax=Methylosinus sp. RM1 TaxID=2583817 RepID=UPI00140B482B|nr:hypothetical protein [Methylosinus sp. RM1]
MSSSPLRLSAEAASFARREHSQSCLESFSSARIFGAVFQLLSRLPPVTEATPRDQYFKLAAREKYLAPGRRHQFDMTGKIVEL